MKKHLLTWLLFLVSAGAGAESPLFEQKALCTVTKINSLSSIGSFSSFLPPQVGSQIVLDAGSQSIEKLDFTDGQMIPVHEPLRRVHEFLNHVTQVHFTAQQYENIRVTGTLVLVLGEFFSSDGKAFYQGRIQSVTQEKLSGLTTVDEAILECELVAKSI